MLIITIVPYCTATDTMVVGRNVTYLFTLVSTLDQTKSWGFSLFGIINIRLGAGANQSCQIFVNGWSIMIMRSWNDFLA